MRRWIRIWPTLVLATATAACGGRPHGEARGKPATPAAAAEAATPASPKAPTVGLALGAGGLTAVDLKTGSTRQAAFGAPRQRAEALIAAAYAPARERGRLEDCGEGPVEFASFGGGLTAYFQDGVLSGWSARDDQALTTMTGVRIGTTRAALEKIDRAPKIEPSTLGQEFTIEGVSGLLDGPGPNARVTNLWSGTACVFR